MTHPKNNKMQISISQDMPQFLVDANTAIAMGQIERAKQLVNDEGIEEVCQIIQKNASRTDIMFMLAPWRSL